ncbi:ATP-binding protein [Nocardia sp. NPDC058658]|uniref:ATP-binding protein n=1 Tax=Nocardia sp. NPDC058658 TaxID=3346580 RepID=UPI00365AA684
MIDVNLSAVPHRNQCWKIILDAAGSTAAFDAADVTDPLMEVIRTLRNEQAVLLLDNCDLVAQEVAPDLVTLLECCPHIAVCATSRLTFNLYSECAFYVAPLVTKATTDSDSTPSPAAQLLHRNIERHCPENEPVANQEQLETVAHTLGGIPLALELAAVTISRAGLGNALELILSGADLGPPPFIDVPLRHRTTHDAVAWSLRMLDSRSHDMLLRMSLFESPFDLPTARMLMSQPELPTNVEVLSTLVTHSLLRQTVHSDGDATTYELFATVRMYCLRILRVDPVLAGRIQRDFLDRVCAMAAVTDGKATSVIVPPNFPRLTADHVSGIYSTVCRLIAHNELGRAVTIAGELTDVWVQHGY